MTVASLAGNKLASFNGISDSKNNTIVKIEPLIRLTIHAPEKGDIILKSGEGIAVIKNLRFVRHGEDLEVFSEDINHPVVIVEGYFLKEPPSNIYAMDDQGERYGYISSGDSSLAASLTDGESSTVQLSDEPVSAASIGSEGSTDNSVKEDGSHDHDGLLGGFLGTSGLAALGGLAAIAGGVGIAAAQSHHNGGHSDAGNNSYSQGKDGVDNNGDTVSPGTPTITVSAESGDITPALSGTAEAGSTVTIRDGDNVLGTTTADADGNWQFTVPDDKALADGSHTLTATATDAAGNTSGTSEGVAISVDSIAPEAPTLTGPEVTGDATPTLSGTAEAGSTVTIRDGDNVLGTTTADADGNWQFTVPDDKALADGSHTLTATATDAAGNTSGTSEGVAIGVDSAAPEAPTILTHPLITGDTTPTLSGTAEAGSTVTIRDGDSVLGTTTADADGNWQFTVPDDKALADGSHTLTATATDAAGNTSGTSEGVAISVDSIAPEAPTLTEPAVAGSTTPTLSGTAEAGSTVTIRDGDSVLGTTTADDKGNWQFTVPDDKALADGSHTLTATATDAAGNTSGTSEGVAIGVDSAAPEAPTITGPSLTGNDTPALSGTAEAGSIVTIRDGDSVLGTTTADDKGNWQFTVPDDKALADGSHTLTATATDAAGNTSGTSEGVAIGVDSVAPGAPTITGPSLTGNDTPALSGTAEAGSTVTIRDGDSVLGTTTADADGNWQFTVPDDKALADGSHTLTATATDAAGNTSGTSEGVAISVDSVAPGAPTITGPSLTGNDTPALSGTAEAGSTVTIRDGDSVLGTTTADADGNWQFTVPDDKALTDGSHTLTATATDAAGNTSGTSEGGAIGVDSVAPGAPTITGPSLTGNDTPALSGTAEAGSTVTIRDGDNVLGTTTADAGGHWQFTVPDDKALADGSHTLTATATDAAGNTSGTSEGVAIGVDSAAPEAPTILTHPLITGDTTPTLSGTAEAGSTVTIRDGDSVLGTTTADADGNWQFTVPDDKALADGSHTLTATATDAAGNTSGTSEGVAISVDSIAPEAPTLTEPAVAGSTTPTLSGTAEAGSTVTIRDGDSVLGTTTADADGNWQFTVPDDKALADGSHTLTATATDAAGNTSGTSEGVAIGVDSAAPEAPTITGPSLTGNDTPALSGTAEAGSIVTIRDGDSVLGTTTADDKGNWQFTVPDDKALADGSHTLTATATDAAGNTSGTSEGVAIGVDSAAPEAPTITGPSLTGNDTPALSGTAEAGSTVTIRDGDSVLGTTTADADGNWQFTVPDDKALADGSHTLTATAADAAGNISVGSDSATVTINPEAPLYGYDEGNVNGKGAGAVHFGTVVENVGDFSGSGGDDIAISAPFDSYGVSNDSGIVYVIRGGYSEMMSQYGNIKALLDEHPEAGVRIYNSGTGASNGQVGGVESDRMAHTITKADLNGDGKPELIIGSHINDKVYVIWGGDDISGNIDLNDIDKGLHPELGFVINSGDNGWFGYNVSAYDYNGDGIDDLLIGDISGATDERGGVFVLYGNKDKPNSDWGNIKLTATAEGPGGTWIPDEKSGLAEGDYGYIHHEDAAAGDMNYNFGTNSINLGDVNGDGFDDLLILDSYANVNGQLNGAAYLLYGSENGFNDSISVSDLSPEQLVKISNISTGAQLGNPSPDAILEGGGTTWEWQPSDKVTAALGDFYHNGDAAYDFAIASPLDSGVGKVWIIKGGATIGNNGALTVGTTAQSHMASDSGFGITGLKAENATDKIHNGAQSFGSRILGGHDIDGDGIPDLIISDPLATNSEGQSVGAVYVVYGGHIDDINKLLDSNNEVRIDQLLENNLAEVHWGSVVNGRFGSDFDVADINGDGRPDIIVGANGADGIPGGENNPDVNCGSVSVIYNKHPFPDAAPSARAFNDEGDNHHPYVLDSDHQTIDLASLTSVLKESHALDMSDGNSTLTVNSQQLNTLANGENGGQTTLTVTGENGNVELTGGAENWHDNGTVTIDGTVYQTYQSSGQSEVQIEDRIHVTIL
jgi:hypothetical protein